jgi:hypothetical protein
VKPAKKQSAKARPQAPAQKKIDAKKRPQLKGAQKPPLISKAKLQQALRASRAGKPPVAYDPRAVKLMLEKIEKIKQKRAEDRARARDSVTFGAELEKLDRQRMVGRDTEASFETPQPALGKEAESAPSGQRIVAGNQELKRQLTDRLNQARHRPQRRR